MNPFDKLRKTDPDKSVKLQRYELKIYIKRLLDDNECLFAKKDRFPPPTINYNIDKELCQASQFYKSKKKVEYFVLDKIAQINEEIKQRNKELCKKPRAPATAKDVSTKQVSTATQSMPEQCGLSVKGKSLGWRK